MKRTIFFVIAIQIFCLISFAQEQKPTKQETMDWIGRKMETAAKTSWKEPGKSVEVRTIKYKQNSVIVTIEIYFPSGNSRPWTFTLNLDKVKGVKINNDSLLVTGNNICKQGPTVNDENYYNKCEIPWVDFKSESDLLNRMKKAFQTLANYNNEVF